ncbi:hypothetical protein TTHERM_00120790 (macronuclear) [Tetrahymena thermophila SB210]|uniref:Leucine Rich Repeat family protein n=1 Tax=Tetrahymena thermophila (strain SB210) TaxID=312017 RepID=Q22YY8_TETTS|nr:hypothetical protein TTHERM_00120790 [Tetrahymena thermophila SB210]EAR90533.1 hypothetical protein TTHERM_00120790 [Tetrahymena thermophila SB210]|eukprot:XP_001010778.1 hypothetical protein TTHERM_00120790 [Tetrahymena thermophila SB210]
MSSTSKSNLQENNSFLPNIDPKSSQKQIFTQTLNRPQFFQHKNIASSLQNTPKTLNKFKVIVSKPQEGPAKNEKRGSFTNTISAITSNRSNSVSAKFNSSSTKNIHASPSRFINDSPRMISKDSLATVLQQKQKQSQQGKQTLQIPSNTVSHFFSKQNLAVPKSQKIQAKQDACKTEIKSNVSDLFLNVSHKEEVVYDESPCKMQQIRDVKKQAKVGLDLKINLNNNQPKLQQNALSDIKYPGSCRHQQDIVLEIIKEDLQSSEKSPNILQLMSPISPTPKQYEQFINPKKSIFNFNDNRLYGDEALNDNPLLKFNKNYKQLERIVQVNDHFNAENSLNVALLEQTIGKNILPRKLGIVKDSQHQFTFPKPDQKHKLDLSNQNISSRYHEMISSAMRHDEMQTLYSINLASNNLTGESLKIITRNLPDSIEKINLEQNNLGANCALGVNPLLNTTIFRRLRILNLENNNISDFGFSQMVDALIQNRSIYSLNLSHNKLTDGSGDIIRQLLKNSSYLQELYLHWNKISSQGGLAIAEGLEDNITLTVLDLSHNGLGALKKLRCGLQIVKNCSIQGSSMRHLDLSFNMFQNDESQDIAQFLQENNRNLFGIHFEGNLGQGVFDSRGFLKFNRNQAQDEKIHQGMIEKRRIKGLKCLGQNKLQNYNCSFIDNCWICDGWQEVKFEIKAGCSDSFLGNPVFLHLDFENYRPHYMTPDPEDPEKFVLYRMCPPNRKIYFFFSDPTQPIIYYSKHYPYTAFKQNSEIELKFYSESVKETQEKQKPVDYFTPTWKFQACTRDSAKSFFQLQYLDSTIVEYIQPSFINCLETKMEQRIFQKHESEPHIKCLPREPETFFQITKTDKWCFEISLFRTYIRDSEDLLNKCFEFDWNNSRCERVLSQSGDALLCKQILRKKYRMIKNCYKFFSSVSMVGDVPGIAQNQFSNLLLKCKVADGKLLKISDGDICFITTNASLEKNADHQHRNPDKQIVRHQFMEAIARLALDKYYRNNYASTSQDSLNLFLDDPLLIEKFLEVGDPQEWRDTRYWNEECDNVLKQYLGFIKILWESIADSKKVEKRYFLNYKTMNVYELQEMIKQYDLLDDFLTERDVLLSFNLAMMTQENELSCDKYIQMNFVEFLECLARLAEKKSMVPVGENPEDYTDQERKNLNLSYKLSSLLEQMKTKYENIQLAKRGEQKQKKEKQFVIKQQVKLTPLVPDAKATFRIISQSNLQTSRDDPNKSGQQEKLNISSNNFFQPTQASFQSCSNQQYSEQNPQKLTKKRSTSSNQQQNLFTNQYYFPINSLDEIDDSLL